jgi:putative proteasome-type protease
LGQIKGEEPQLFLIYPQGNHIQATKETPFLQIGETKYGNSILDSTITYDTPLEEMAKCALLFDRFDHEIEYFCWTVYRFEYV